MKNIVAYYRSSTREQQYSIEVQKSQMHDFIERNGFILIAEYMEHHSGKDNSRLELTKAIDHCIRENFTLAFTKLDRLSRRASFLYQIKESELDLICLDLPELNTITYGIFAILAQYERELISQRTSRTLQEIRKVKKLGNPYAWEKNRAIAIETKKKNRKAWLESDDMKKALNIINLLSSRNKKPSLREIARFLNYHGIRTQRGKIWNACQVRKVFIDLSIRS